MVVAVAGIPVQIWQAGTAGSVVAAAGWMVNGWSNRRDAERLRVIRQRDMLTALRAEMGHYLEALKLFDLDQAWETTVIRMERDASYHPLIPTEENDRIFRALITDIPLLPHATVAAISRYYNQIAAIDAMIADLRNETPGRDTQAQRIAMYTDYISLKKEAIITAEQAISAIDGFFDNDAYMHARRQAERDIARRVRRDAKISASVRRLYKAKISQTAPTKQPAAQVSSPDAGQSGQQSARGI